MALKKGLHLELGKLGLPIVENPSLYSVSGWDANYWAPYHKALNSTVLGLEVLDRLTKDERVQALSGKMIARGSGAEAFDLQKLGLWFLWRVNLKGLEAANAELESFLSSEYTQAINTLWITGLDVKEEIDLTGGFRILPVSQMPETLDRAVFMGFDASFTAGISVKPRAAIVILSKVRSTWGDEPSHDGKMLLDEFMAASAELYDIALLINACRGVFCLPHYSTSYLADSVPYGPFGGSGGGYGSYDVVTHGTVEAGPELGAQVTRLHAAFRKLPKEQKYRFRVIFDRLSQAKHRQKLEDKILDLGITLEMLLLKDNSNKDQLSQSFRLRGSWLLGKNPEERHYLYTLLKELYQYRNEVAHGGVLSNKSRTSAGVKYREFEKVAEDACAKIICDGEPKWETLLLGAI